MATVKLGDVFTFTNNRCTILGRSYRDARPGEHFLVVGDGSDGGTLYSVRNLSRHYTVVWRDRYFKDDIRVIGAFPVGEPDRHCACECESCDSCEEYQTAFLPVAS